MKITHYLMTGGELSSGLLIFAGAALFFLLMEASGLNQILHTRLLNVIFIFFGVNRILRMNLAQGQNNFLLNAVSAMTASFTGVVLSLAALMIYSYARGGDAYIKSLPQTLMYGGEPSVPLYILCFLFEGCASCIATTVVMMLYLNSRFKTG
ncbi:hypothetical protein [Flavobacterium chungbukense]|uniref:hypothetical protein n=1 Tax=Flavobacterium chungbukense TaxID=877464 RepID=UPI001E583EE2|nr:hypothetical protein [Flavobacterium chungbukense]MCC4920555.1 hypothetical protein [Flavobacterium chungbukense]